MAECGGCWELHARRTGSGRVMELVEQGELLAEHLSFRRVRLVKMVKCKDKTISTTNKRKKRSKEKNYKRKHNKDKKRQKYQYKKRRRRMSRKLKEIRRNSKLRKIKLKSTEGEYK